MVAPLALVVAVVGVLVVVQASTTDTSGTSGRTSTTQRPSTQRSQPAARRRPRVYVVKPGDTLSAVAERTGVPLETIEQLNPDVDPQALLAGQRLKLGP